MKILILGHGQHGKDTFAKMVAERDSLNFVSSSIAAFEEIKPVLELLFPTMSDKELYEQRRGHRQLWKRLISLFNANDKAALAKRVLSYSDIYVGMRSKDEYEASRHLFDIVYYVDASRRVHADPSMEIEFDPANMVPVDNNRTLEDLQKTVDIGFV